MYISNPYTLSIQNNSLLMNRIALNLRTVPQLLKRFLSRKQFLDVLSNPIWYPPPQRVATNLHYWSPLISPFQRVAESTPAITTPNLGAPGLGTKGNPNKEFYTGTNLAHCILNSAMFVDNTLFVKEVLECSRRLFIVRPRREGKTLGLSTLQYFINSVNSEGKKVKRTLNESKLNDPKLESKCTVEDKKVNHSLNESKLYDPKFDSECTVERKLFFGGTVTAEESSAYLGEAVLKPIKLPPTNISKWENAETEFASHPVISFDFGSIKADNIDEFYKCLKGKITDLYEKFSYLLKYLKSSSSLKNKLKRFQLYMGLGITNSNVDISKALYFLVRMLYDYHLHTFKSKSKIVLLIDEIDTFTNSQLPQQTTNNKPNELSFLKQCSQIISNMVNVISKDSDCDKYVDRIVMTGVYKCIYMDTSKLNDFTISELFNKLGVNSLGVRKEDVIKLTGDLFPDISKEQNEMFSNNLLKRYNGYTELSEGQVIPTGKCNIVSTHNAFYQTAHHYKRTKKINLSMPEKGDWSGRLSVELITSRKMILNNAYFIDTMMDLWRMKTVQLIYREVNLYRYLDEPDDAPLTYILCDGGYLTLAECTDDTKYKTKQDTADEFKCFKIPNEEIRNFFSIQLMPYWISTIAGIKNADWEQLRYKIVNSINKPSELEIDINLILQKASLVLKSEKQLSTILFGAISLFSSKFYEFISEARTTHGTIADAFAIPKNKGEFPAIFECKVYESGSKHTIKNEHNIALWQIIFKQYLSLIESHLEPNVSISKVFVYTLVYYVNAADAKWKASLKCLCISSKQIDKIMEIVGYNKENKPGESQPNWVKLDAFIQDKANLHKMGATPYLHEIIVNELKKEKNALDCSYY